MNGLANKQIIAKATDGSYIYNLEVTPQGASTAKNYAVAVFKGIGGDKPHILTAALLPLLAGEFNRSFPNNIPATLVALFEQDIKPAIQALGFTYAPISQNGLSWGGWSPTQKDAQLLTDLATDKIPTSTEVSTAAVGVWIGANNSRTDFSWGATDNGGSGTDNGGSGSGTGGNALTRSASKLWENITKFAKENPVAVILIVVVIGFLGFKLYQVYQKSQVEKRMKIAKGSELKALKKEYARLAD